MEPDEARVLLVIPAYNESETIGNVIERSLQLPSNLVNEIVVVDDASTDSTREVVQEFNDVSLLTHQVNCGYGAAQRTGHLWGIKKGFDYIVQCDGDGQHQPEDIPDLLDEAITKECDILLGSRFRSEGDPEEIGRVRRIGIRFFSAVVQYLGGEKVTDITSGFKVYSTDVLTDLNRPNDQHPAVQQVLEACINGFTVCEISVKMQRREHGSSHLNLMRMVVYPILMVEVIMSVLIFRREA